MMTGARRSVRVARRFQIAARVIQERVWIFRNRAWLRARIGAQRIARGEHFSLRRVPMSLIGVGLMRAWHLVQIGITAANILLTFGDERWLWHPGLARAGAARGRQNESRNGRNSPELALQEALPVSRPSPVPGPRTGRLLYYAAALRHYE